MKDTYAAALFFLISSTSGFADVKVIDSGKVDVGAIVVSPEGGLGIINQRVGEAKSGTNEAEQIKAYGYIDKRGQTSKIQSYAGLVESTISSQGKNVYDLQELRDETGPKIGEIAVVRLSSGKRVDYGAPMYPFGPIGSEYKNADNVGHLVILGGRIAQLHTSTVFGSLLAEEFTVNKPGAVDAWVIDPNIEVLGAPGKIVRNMYGEDSWTTTLFVPHGDKIVLLECDSKLSEDQTEALVRLATDLIRSGA